MASSVRTASDQAGVVTVSGSVPPGTPADGNPTGRPAILHISHNAVRFHGSLLPIARATATVAEGCEAPLTLHLDHVEDESLLLQAADAGAAGAARFVRIRRRATASSCRCRNAGKINVGTALNIAFTGAVRATLETQTSTDPRKYLTPAREAMTDVVADFRALTG